MSSGYIIAIILGNIIGLFIIYFLIKWAIKDATEEIKRSLKISNHLKAAEMKKQGFTDEDISKIISSSK